VFKYACAKFGAGVSPVIQNILQAALRRKMINISVSYFSQMIFNIKFDDGRRLDSMGVDRYTLHVSLKQGKTI